MRQLAERTCARSVDPRTGDVVTRWLSPSLCALLLLLLLLSVLTGAVAITPDQAAQALFAGGDPIITTILFDIRLPRAFAAALTGAALGISGAAMQGLLRNPLAEPGTLGVSASAATAATAVVYFGLAASAPWLVPIASLIGACAATALISTAAWRMRGVASLILLGVALSALSGAIMALFVNLAPNPFSLSDLINWTAGSVANRDWGDIALSAPFIAAGAVLLMMVRRPLGVLALGEEVAHGLGVDLSRTRLAVIIGTGLATGGAVALAGMVGFVGLVAPHAVRAAVRRDAGAALLPSALAGAILTVIADMGIRLFPWGSELHLGTLAALIGAPLFIALVFRLGNIRHG
ncbi:MAG: iron ABC transporter permease [Sphingopyxis sp.]